MHRSSLPAVALVLSAILMSGGRSVCRAQPPAVTRIETVSFGPGQTATLTAHGTALKNVLYLWTPVGQLPFQPPDGKPSETVAHFQGQLPETTRPGVYETRVVTAQGISARRFLLVDDLPTFALPDACEIQPPTVRLPAACCFNGYINALKPKFFGLDLKQGQQLSIEIFARRLDSALDPVLRLIGPDGQELLFADDTPGLGGDAQLSVTASADGLHTLELRDVQYSGGGGHYYHLRVGRFPLVQGSYPRRASATANISLVGAGIDDLPAAAAALPGQMTSPVSLPGEQGSSIGAVATVSAVPVMEQEPNDTRETATSVDVSAEAISGRFRVAADVDWYRLVVTEPQHLCLTAHSREVGSPADVVLEIHDAAGKKLQESDDTGTSDAQLALALPAAGDYFVAVRELGGHGGPAWTYDLEVDRGGRIEVTTATDTVAVPKGGTVTIPVVVKRLGFPAPFEISAVKLPEGLTATPVVVAEQQKTALIAVHAGADTPDVYQQRFEIHATVGADTRPLHVMYSPPPGDKNAANNQLPRLQTGVFAYATAPAAFSLTAEPAALVVSKGAEVRATITAVRTGEWKEAIDLASAVPAAELPSGVTVTAAQITENTAEVVIKADDKAKPGRFTLSLQGTLKKDKTTVVQPVPTIILDVKEAAAPQPAG